MIKPIKFVAIVSAFILLVSVSFAAGQRIRQISAQSPLRDARVASTPESHIGSSDTTSVPNPDADDDPAATFLEVLKYVQEDYVDKYDDTRKMSFGAVRTMVSSLDDPRTRFLDPDQRKNLERQLNGEFVGIGANVSVLKQMKGTIEQRRLGVVAPAPGGPAEKAGIKAGDVITEIDGKWVIAYDPRIEAIKMRTDGKDEKVYRQAFKDAAKKLEDGLSLQKAIDQLFVKDGKSLVLTVERTGAPAPIKLTVTTATVKVEPVEFRALSEKVAYLRVTQFNAQATELFTKALTAAKQKSLILDLRNNTGGPLVEGKANVMSSAMALVGQLTPGGQVATLLKKNDVKEPLKTTSSAKLVRKVAVLVNAGTANVAELVASAIREKGVGTLIGGSTSGDSAQLKLFGLREGAAVTVRAGKFLTSKGSDFSEKGLKPDVVLETGGPVADDLVVKKAAVALGGV